MLGRSDQLFRTAVPLTRDSHSTQDLLQSALARAWRSWDRIEGEPEASQTTLGVLRRGGWLSIWTADPSSSLLQAPPMSSTGDREVTVTVEGHDEHVEVVFYRTVVDG